MIEDFPKRYDQIPRRRVGQGVELSGGQWQKLVLTRAYMLDAAVIILD